ncbi:hypothetical protein [Amycolatopsis speibonae]|uniref:Secreted protein/lipoprotein n=1 Tax=Amycolatopsis speibonae TaxID=1450224 RepID=A0ABV7P1G1_9PSEU
MRPKILLCLGLVLVAAAACAETKADPMTPRHRQVKQDYLAYWDAMLRANAVSDPDSPALGERTAGRQLALVRTALTRARETGIVAKGKVGHDLREISVDRARASVVDCVTIKDWIQYDAKTDTVKADQLFARPNQLVRYTLAPRGNGWLVTDYQDMGTC